MKTLSLDHLVDAVETSARVRRTGLPHESAARERLGCSLGANMLFDFLPVPSRSFSSFRALSRSSALVLSLGALSLGAACDMAGDGDTDAGEPEAQAVEVTFAAKVAGADFTCGETYSNIGTQNSDITPLDFRFYVHDVELIDADGNAVAVELDVDGKWQTERVALLDFEDGSGSCDNGNADTNAKVVGMVPAGDYDGLRFKVGVPFEDNHADVTLADSPLNIPSMFWNWNGGYKFVRIDNNTSGVPSFNVHVGSTACDGDMMGNVNGCDNENRPAFAFDTFDPASNVVVLDLAELLAGVDVDTNSPDTPPGCMSVPSDPECAPIFDALGVDDGAGNAFFVE